MAEHERGKPYEPPLGELFQEILAYQNTHQRARVLIDLAKIDNFLERLLFTLVKAPLSPGEYKSLFGTDAPLGTTSARREALFAFGLIDSDINKAIRCLAHIRNLFAHRVTIIDMNHEALQQSLLELKKLLPRDRRQRVSKFKDKSEKRLAIYNEATLWVLLSFIPRFLDFPQLPPE